MSVIISDKIDVPYDEKALNDVEDPELKRVTDYLITLIKFLRKQLSDMADAININSSVTITIVEAATYTVEGTDDILHVRFTNTAAVTITLPTVQATDSRVIVIKDADGNAATNNITIETEGSETIDGATNFVMNVDSMSIDIYLIDSNWFVY